MKLGKHDFAKLVAFIQKLVIIRNEALTSYDIEDIDSLIDVDVPDAPKANFVNGNEVNQLMMLMQEGTRKIEAIKTHRTITGYGLKESKDAIEKYWISKGHYDPTSPVASQPATLGDILHSAGLTNDGTYNNIG